MHTIVAISTAPGFGAIGMIRLSGDKSLKILSKVFLVKSQLITPNAIIDRKATFGKIVEQEKILDQVVVTCFKAPNSYTGEDLVEICCHGGRIILQRIIDVLIKYGAILAEPGEYTKRAFLNNKMDLLQAEAVEELILAENDLALDAAQDLIEGKVSTFINRIKDQLINIISEYEAEIEFPEESDVTEKLQKLQKQRKDKINNIIKTINNTINSYDQGILIKEGFVVAIFGAPNTGKSTLLNQLVGYERALVSNTPGTTRDYIREKIVVNGIHVTFIDMAGIRKIADDIEKVGIEHSKDILTKVNAALFIVDGSNDLTDNDYLALKYLPDNIAKICVINKIDKKQKIHLNDSIFSENQTLKISALNGHGIEQLLSSLQKILNKDQLKKGNEIIITHIRHKNCLTNCLNRLQNVIKLIKTNQDTEIISYSLTEAMTELQILTGEITIDNILNNIFENFCIGK